MKGEKKTLSERGTKQLISSFSILCKEDGEREGKRDDEGKFGKSKEYKEKKRYKIMILMVVSILWGNEKLR